MTGIDRVRTLLIEAKGAADAVLVWGPFPAFNGPVRQVAWDVPQAVVVAEAVALGWTGLRLVEGRAVEL